MLTNYHTHTVFCDGKDNVDQVVKTAIKKSFKAIGFSGHAYTPYDESYCMKDTDEYINLVNAAKKQYDGKIQVYLGIEEDAYAPVDRQRFDYIIGSCHYVFKDGNYYPVDDSYELFKKALAAFNDDPLAYSESYYSAFCDYILKRKPDIIGHFDLITKFDELNSPCFLNCPNYARIAEKYLKIALKSDCIFEVNTGAICRGYRKTPYPAENLLRILRQNDGKIILSSDCHDAEKLDFFFTETVALLKKIGFTDRYVLFDGKFKKIPL